MSAAGFQASVYRLARSFPVHLNSKKCLKSIYLPLLEFIKVLVLLDDGLTFGLSARHWQKNAELTFT